MFWVGFMVEGGFFLQPPGSGFLKVLLMGVAVNGSVVRGGGTSLAVFSLGCSFGFLRFLFLFEISISFWF